MTLHYVYRKCDRRRWKKELRAFRAVASPVTLEIVRCIYRKDGEKADRLALADLAEEAGFDYLAMFLRTNLTTVKPVRRKRQTKYFF